MTFEQLDHDLPNGFHDAEIQKVIVDYAEHSAIIIMRLLVGTPHSANSDEYRPATLKISGLYYYSIDLPNPKYPFVRGAAINVAGCPEDPQTFPDLNSLLAMMPKGVTCYRFFVHEWNSFIHIAANDVQFSWLEDGMREESLAPPSRSTLP